MVLDAWHTESIWHIIVIIQQKTLSGFTSLRKTLDDNVHSVTPASLPNIPSSHVSSWTLGCSHSDNQGGPPQEVWGLLVETSVENVLLPFSFSLGHSLDPLIPCHLFYEVSFASSYSYCILIFLHKCWPEVLWEIPFRLELSFSIAKNGVSNLEPLFVYVAKSQTRLSDFTSLHFILVCNVIHVKYILDYSKFLLA